MSGQHGTSAVGGSNSSASVDGSGSNVSKSAKMEALLEQLRTKHNASSSSLPSDSWNEFAKQIRMASLDLNKQFKDPAVIHEALEKLQAVMSANSLPQILERIISACSKLGMKSSEQGNTVYISNDLFYLELICDRTPTNQSVRDVRLIHHGSSPTSPAALLHALRQANVSLFMEHIKGYREMYMLYPDTTVVTKNFIVRQSLETDIDKINKAQLAHMPISDITRAKNINLGGHIYKLPLGLVQPRVGGLRMKLTFFITPYDFLNEKEGTSYPMSIESINNLDLGMSATIGLEQQPAKHQLQTIPLLNYARTADNRLGTQFVPITNINSVEMEAAFVLKFKTPIALSQQVIKQIERQQGSCAFSDTITMMPMLDAIVKSGCESMVPGSNRFTTYLPGQVQNYYINDLKSNGEPMMGGVVTKLPFTHPTFLPQAIGILRQQLILNTMVLSCVVRSSNAANADTKAINMELKVVSHQLLTVTFKHPFADSVATVDFDLTDVSAPKCSIHSNTGGDLCSNSLATKVVQRCFSIPVTMRSILKQAGHEEENLPPPAKKVKADHGEIMQKISDVYTARGHYVPYGSVNTASTSYTKNITTNKYPLCMRRFSGYKRSCFTSLSLPNTLSIVPPKPSSQPHMATTIHSNLASDRLRVHVYPSPVADKHKVNTTPMLSSLLDDKDSRGFANIKPSAHPLVSEPTQGHTSQLQASMLTDLLGGPGGQSAPAIVVGAEKKPKKVRQRRRTSETSMTPEFAGPSAGIVGTSNTTSAAAKKRKKNDNEEIIRELTSKVKAEVTEQQSVEPSGALNSTTKLKTNVSLGSNVLQYNMTAGKLSSSKPSHGDSQLAQLLHDTDAEKKPNKTTMTTVVTVDDFFESARQMKQEALHAEMKGPTSFTIKTTKPKKSSEEKKGVKHSSSVDSLNKEKKAKRSESVEPKFKESKSVDQILVSPAKKTVNRIVAKPKVKAQSKVEIVMGLPVRNPEDRASPKEKVKRQGSEKDKKKRTSKSPSLGSASDFAGKQPNQDQMKMGFYGASNLRSLPKIPKRKPGEILVPNQQIQTSPTSPTPPALQQKSPVPVEWQKTSPVPNRSLLTKAEELQSAGAINRQKSYPPPTTDSLKRPALLPTPHTPPIAIGPQKIFQRKTSLTDVIHRLSHPGAASYAPAPHTATSQSLQHPRYSTLPSQRGHVEPSPNSPDEQLGIASDTQPVFIPTQPVVNDPSSPSPELVTQAPKSIPLDHNKALTESSTGPKSILKQKAVTLTFSPSSINDNRMDDVAMLV